MRTIRELSVEELQNVIKDLQFGARYNDVKTKYNLAPNAVSANTITECEKLLAELQPKEKKFTGYLSVNSDPVLQQKALAGGAKVDANGYYVW